MEILVTKNIHRLDTKKYTVKDIEDEIKEDLNILKHLGVESLATKEIEVCINSRFTRTLGLCKDKGNNFFTIKINESFLRSAEPQSIHDTIMHEVIHTCKGCYNHGPEWHRVGNLVSKKFGFTITRTYNDSSYSQFMRNKKATRIRYQIGCPNCGIIKECYSPTKVFLGVKQQEKTGQPRYRCNRCKNRNLYTQIFNPQEHDLI